MEDLRANDRGRAGMPGSGSDGQQRGAEAEAEHAGFREEQGRLRHESVGLLAVSGGGGTTVVPVVLALPSFGCISGLRGFDQVYERFFVVLWLGCEGSLACLEQQSPSAWASVKQQQHYSSNNDNNSVGKGYQQRRQQQQEQNINEVAII